MDYINAEEIMIENREITELKEQFENKAEVDKALDFYRVNSCEALEAGDKDMHEYYKAKISDLCEVRKEMVKEECAKVNEQIYERKQKSIAETQDLLDEIKMDQIVHGAPRYTGLGYTESEWKYEASKEYRKNGETAHYKDLMRKAADAHVEAELDKILK